MALPTSGDNVEDLILRITVESEQALSNVGAFRAQVDAMKAAMKKAAAETGESFNFIAASMRKTFVEDSKASIDNFRALIRQAQDGIKSLRADLAAGKNLGTGNMFAPGEKEITEQGIKALQANIESYRQSIKGIQTEMNTLKTVSGVALKEANKESQNAAKGFKLLGIEINNIGDIAKVVFIGILGGSVIGVLTKLLQLVSELTQKGLEFSKATFQLELGVRALRRAGIDLTFDEVLANLDDINAGLGNMFSKLELIQGAAAFTNLIRDLGLAKDQVLLLQKATTTLAVVNGRSMEDVQRTVALAISSGYTEGLQRLGVSINRLTIAEEANRLGFKGGYTALTEQQRALATYNLIIQKTALYADDVAKAQDTLFGSIQKSNSTIETQKALVGETYLPFKAAVLQVVAALFELGRKFNFVFIIARGVAAIFSEINIAAEATAALLKNLFPRNPFGGLQTGIANLKSNFQSLIPDSVQNAIDTFIDGMGQAKDAVDDLIRSIADFIAKHPALKKFLVETKKNLDSIFGGGKQELTFEGQVDLGTSKFNEQQDKLLGMLEEQFGDIDKLEKELADERKKINDDLQDDLAKIEQDGVDDRRKIIQDYGDDIAKLERDTARRIQEVLIGLQQKLTNIDIKLKFNIDEANLKFNFDVAEVQRKFNDDVAKAQEEYRQKEIERERKYQEQLLKLREDFLLDLEDALEKRDARAVLRAVRQFNLDKARAARENEIAKLGGKEGLANEIKDLQARRDARIRELKFELEQRLAELRRNADFERAEAARNANQDIQDLQRKLADEKAERDRAFEQEKRDQLVEEGIKRARAWMEHVRQLADLKAQNDEKLAEIARFLQAQGDLLGLSTRQVTEVINAAFGPGGVAQTIIAGYTAFVISQIEAMKAAINGLPKNFEFKPGTQQPGKKHLGGGGFASGGAAVAKKPTDVTFGEVPEVAIFAPLNQLDKLPDLLGGLMGGAGGGGKLTLKVSLESGLKAEIVDSSVGAVADILFERNRTRESLA